MICKLTLQWSHLTFRDDIHSEPWNLHPPWSLVELPGGWPLLNETASCAEAASLAGLPGSKGANDEVLWHCRPTNLICIQNIPKYCIHILCISMCHVYVFVSVFFCLFLCMLEFWSATGSALEVVQNDWICDAQMLKTVLGSLNLSQSIGLWDFKGLVFFRMGQAYLNQCPSNRLSWRYFSFHPFQFSSCCFFSPFKGSIGKYVGVLPSKPSYTLPAAVFQLRPLESSGRSVHRGHGLRRW